MFEQIKRLLKNSGMYGIGMVASKAVGFFLIPVYTRYLRPSDYGVLELLDLIVFFAGVIAAMGIYNAVFRFYAAYDAERDKREVISTALLYTAGLSLLLMAVLIGAAPLLAKLILGSKSYAGFVRIVAVTLLFSNLSEVPLAYWRAQERAGLFVSVTLARTILSAGLLVVAVAWLRAGVRGVVYANLATSAIWGSALFALTLFKVPRTINPKKLKEMLVYGLPLAVQSLASFVLVFSDRFFLRYYGNLNEVGVYSLGYKLAGVIAILVSGPFNFAWQWQQFEVAKDDDRRLYAKIQTYQLIVSLALGVAVAVFAKDALRILTPPFYWAAARIVPIIALSYIVENMRAVVLSGIFVKKVTHHLAWIMFVVAGVNLLLNVTLIARYLAVGAAVATLLSYILSLSLAFIAAQRVFHVRYEYGRAAFAIGSAALIYGVSTTVHLPVVQSLFLNGILFICFIGACSLLFSKEERRMLRRLLLQAGEQVGIKRGVAQVSAAARP